MRPGQPELQGPPRRGPRHRRRRLKVSTLLRLGPSDVVQRARDITALHSGTARDSFALHRPGIADAGTQAKTLEDAGFDGVFTIEAAHDVFLPLALAAQAAPRLELTTNVALGLPRSPLHLAHAAYDLQALARGKFRLGLGSQVKPVVERMFSARWDKPVAQMRELVLATKAILAHWQFGTPLDYEGRYYHHQLMTPPFNPGPNPFDLPPILLAALGPRMTRMAAEVADGVLVHPFHSRRFLDERVLPAVQEGLAVSGRDLRGFQVVANVIVVTGRDETELAAAEAGTRALLAFYASTPAYLPLLEFEGLADLHHELNGLSRQSAWPEMAALIDDDVMGRFAVCGDPKEAAAAVRNRCAGLNERVGVYLPYDAASDLLGQLADGFGSAGAVTTVL